MKRSAGFTLLELLLALALLAMTLGLLMASSARASRQVQAAAAQNRAVMYAENLLDDLNYGTPLQVGKREGTFEDPRFRWQLVIRTADQDAALALPMPTAAAPMALYQIELRVLWDQQALTWQTLRAAQATQEISLP